MTMSIMDNHIKRTSTDVRFSGVGIRREYGGLDDTPAGYMDRDFLLHHLGRKVIHASVDRNFSRAYYTDNTGVRCPRMYRIDSKAFQRCQYVMLTNKQYAAVLVIDIDRPGTAGGHPINLAPDVKSTLAAFVAHGVGPSWVGINPVSGKAQAMWLVDPVYAGKEGKSSNMALLVATAQELGSLLDHDPHFSHCFSRSPFYLGNDPTAYHWYCQHKRVYRLGDLLKEVRAMAGIAQHEKKPRQRFTSGRDLINAVKARREQAQAFQTLAGSVDAELEDCLSGYDPELIDGVRVLWIDHAKAARDETAFRHALKTGYKLKAAGKRMTDAVIIDAYEHAYAIAHSVGAAGRVNELPPMRDRQTMARRVRGYVTTAKTTSASTYSSGESTTTERKALATMGRKGGQKAAQRWKTNPNGEYATERRKALSEANKQRKKAGNETRGRVFALYTSIVAQTDNVPTGKQLAEELGLTKRTVNLHLKVLREAGLLS